MKVERADDVTKLASDRDRGIYFWRIDGIQACSHITKFTPLACERHGVAFDTVCPSCRAQGLLAGQGKKQGSAMSLEPKVTEREIECELTDEEKEARKTAFTAAWEKEQQVKAEKALAMQGFNADLKELRGLEKALHDAFTSGKEKRLVEVYERPNERLHSVELVDRKSGKVLDSRPMTPDERQGKMFTEDGKPAVKAKGNGKAPKPTSTADLFAQDEAVRAENKRKRALAKEPLKAPLGEVAANGKAKRAKRKRASSSEARA